MPEDKPTSVKIEEVLKKALEEKEDNLILLNLDRHHQSKIVEREKPQDEKDKVEHEKLTKELKECVVSLERVKGEKNKEKIVGIEGKIRKIGDEVKVIKDRHSDFKKSEADLKDYAEIIKEAEFLLETIKECISDSSKIYGE